MRSGLLNERLTVMRPTTTKDVNGAETVVLEAVGSYWCHVLHNRHDRSDNDVDRVVYNPEIRFELRASVPIADNDVIDFDGKRYVIDMIEKNHNLDRQTLYCTRYEQ